MYNMNRIAISVLINLFKCKIKFFLLFFLCIRIDAH
jgi:hypothetical protein